LLFDSVDEDDVREDDEEEDVNSPVVTVIIVVWVTCSPFCFLAGLWRRWTAVGVGDADVATVDAEDLFWSVS
jgi:hypothetical protein